MHHPGMCCRCSLLQLWLATQLTKYIFEAGFRLGTFHWQFLSYEYYGELMDLAACPLGLSLTTKCLCCTSQWHLILLLVWWTWLLHRLPNLSQQAQRYLNSGHYGPVSLTTVVNLYLWLTIHSCCGTCPSNFVRVAFWCCCLFDSYPGLLYLLSPRPVHFLQPTIASCQWLTLRTRMFSTVHSKYLLHRERKAKPTVCPSARCSKILPVSHSTF